jgi:hypothetical protein
MGFYRCHGCKSVLTRCPWNCLPFELALVIVGWHPMLVRKRLTENTGLQESLP